MSKPTFSVVVPAFRSAGTIGTTMRSIAAQTMEDFEVVVVDDGSPEDIQAAVSAAIGGDARFRVLRQPNQGPACARNFGIAQSHGELVGFLDSDDAWLPTYLEEAARALVPADTGIGHADAWGFRDSDKRVFRRTTLQIHGIAPGVMSADELLTALLRINFVTTSAVTVRRTAFEAAGGFNVEMDGSEDWDLWLRIAEAGFGATTIGTSPLLLLRDLPTSLSKGETMMARSAATVLADAASRLPQSDPRRLPALDASSAFLAGSDEGIFRKVASWPLMRPAKSAFRTHFRYGPPPPTAAEALRSLGEL